MEALLFNIQKFSLHDGPGIRTTLFFKGCNLRCKWCANPESQSAKIEFLKGEACGRIYTLDAIVAEVLKDKPFYDKSGGGVTLSGGEPLLQSDFVLALCDALHYVNITVGIETAANVPFDVFAAVIGKSDFVLFDLKHHDAKSHKAGTGTDNSQILSNLRYALAQSIPVTVRIPVIPGFNDSEADARAFAFLLRGLGAKDVHVLPFHQMGESKYESLQLPYAYSGIPQLHDADLTTFADNLKTAGLAVQVGG